MITVVDLEYFFLKTSLMIKFENFSFALLKKIFFVVFLMGLRDEQRIKRALPF